MSDFYDFVSAEAAKNIDRWLNEPKYVEYRSQLEEMIVERQWQTLEDAFFQVIEFGTGGIRGTTGLGSNRINRVTIGEAAQALCEYAKSFDDSAPEKGIAIACDTRLTSDEFSRYVAEVCAGNGFKVYLFDSFRATPELSFAVRHLGCAAGIVISASHNPPADNGFKAYWNDGAQLVAPHDKAVVALAKNITTIDLESDSPRIETIGSGIDDAYIAAVLEQAEGTARDLTIVYSPLHGAGQTNTLPVLQGAGFSKIIPVESQMTPDGNFPTIENGKPNPEEKAANDRAVAEMLAEQADIAITNDPDADRIGVMVNHHGEPVYLSGNQAAVLATEFSLRKLSEKDALTAKHFIAKTIVTTDMMKAVADKYGATTYGDMLIGFKYIGELLRDKQDSDEVFVIGGEESYGLLKGTYARDKDGAVGALPLAEYAAELKQDGKTLIDRLEELYDEYGIYRERLDTIVCPGASGFEQMQTIMKQLRLAPPTSIEGHAITAITDYNTLTKRITASGEERQVPCNTTGNVVVLEFGDIRRRITVRPSGTEPKLKFYIQWFDEPGSDISGCDAMLEAMSRQLEGMLLEA